MVLGPSSANEKPSPPIIHHGIHYCGDERTTDIIFLCRGNATSSLPRGRQHGTIPAVGGTHEQNHGGLVAATARFPSFRSAKAHSLSFSESSFSFEDTPQWIRTAHLFTWRRKRTLLDFVVEQQPDRLEQ
jgi:hypothetical protein